MVKEKKGISGKPRPSRHDAPRVEFLAIEERIDGFLQEGYSWKAIYDFFKEKGFITMSYGTFCRYLNGSNRPTSKQRNRFGETKEKGLVTPVRKHVEQEGQRGPVVLSQSTNTSFTKKEEIPREDIV